MTDESRYYAARGARFNDEDAQELGTAFDGLEDLRPECIVEAAQAKKSPIHCYFEWDDKVAAQCWRREQARYYLVNIRIEIETTGDLVRAFHPIKVVAEEPSTFKSIGKIAQNPDWAAQIKERAVRDLESSQRRLRQYAVLGDAFMEIVDGPVQEAIDQLKELPAGT